MDTPNTSSGTVYGSAVSSTGGDNPMTGVTTSGDTITPNHKRVFFKIGRRSVGAGGLVSLLAAVVLGGGVAVVAVRMLDAPDPVLRAAVGSWELDGPQKVECSPNIPDVQCTATVTNMTLEISSSGLYQANLTASAPGRPDIAGGCIGDVTARDDLLVFTPKDVNGNATTCDTVTATVSADGKQLVFGQPAQKLRLRRA